MNKRVQLTKSILEIGGILLGCFIVAVAFVLFINPYKLVPGGVFGLSIVLHQLFPSIQVGTFGYIIEVPVLILSALCLGKKVGSRTLVASFAAPLFMNIITPMVYPNQAAMEKLDPSLLLDGRIDLSNDMILATLLGPVLIAAGTVLIVKCGATSGGSDVIAMIISKYARIKFTKALLCVDGFVVLLGLLVIGFGIGGDSESTGSGSSWVLSVYSLICIVVLSKTLAYLISGSKNDKVLFIVAPVDVPRLRHFILHDLDRTATCIHSHGLYKQEEKNMMMLVVHQKEVDFVTTRIKHFCPDVFIIVTDAYDAYGERWNRLPEPGELVMK